LPTFRIRSSHHQRCAGNRYQIANPADYRRSMTQWTQRGRLLVPESDDDVVGEQHENDQVRDTYAYYGLAMYMAHVFEHEVVNLLVLARIAEAQKKGRADTAPTRTIWRDDEARS